NCAQNPVGKGTYYFGRVWGLAWRQGRAKARTRQRGWHFNRESPWSILRWRGLLRAILVAPRNKSATVSLPAGVVEVGLCTAVAATSVTAGISISVNSCV